MCAARMKQRYSETEGTGKQEEKEKELNKNHR